MLQDKILYEQDFHEKNSKHGTQGNGEKLICKKSKNHYDYYVGGKYISKRKEMGRLRKLAEQEYRRKLLDELRIECKYLRRVLETDRRLSDVYRNMHKGKQALIEPDYEPIEKRIEKFETAKYNGLGFSDSDQTEYITNRGERVRSKSEKIIADELARQGIPYKYEKPLQLNVDGMMKTFYPDFTVMNVTTGEIKYLEHLGMVDSSNYLKNTLSKLDVYEKNGLLIGREVILLHESAYRPLNTRVITDYIREFLA
ncbi:MAG: hypothetical protein IKX10_10545 [Lachnospiraceae bacterium]|nr:hypothetical protein [Lachnospiraceae bacterium]